MLDSKNISSISYSQESAFKHHKKETGGNIKRIEIAAKLEIDCGLEKRWRCGVK
jgi:hypothetical protein